MPIKHLWRYMGAVIWNCYLIQSENSCKKTRVPVHAHIFTHQNTLTFSRPILSTTSALPHQYWRRQTSAIYIHWQTNYTFLKTESSFCSECMLRSHVRGGPVWDDSDGWSGSEGDLFWERAVLMINWCARLNRCLHSERMDTDALDPYTLSRVSACGWSLPNTTTAATTTNTTATTPSACGWLHPSPSTG